MKGNNTIKKIGGALLQISVLAFLLYVAFHNSYREIFASVRSVGLNGFVLLVVLGLVYQMLDAMACHKIIAARIPDFTMPQAIEFSYLSVLGRISLLGMGAFPLQTAYLHRCGMQPGDSLGMMTISYALHKTGVVICAAGLLLAGGRALWTTFPVAWHWVWAGFGICVAIILALYLVCTWGGLQSLAQKLCTWLPDTAAWEKRKQYILSNLAALYNGAHELLNHPADWIGALLLHVVKLLWMNGMTIFCMRLLGITQISRFQALVWTAVCLVLAGACPSAAGLGPIELSFLWLFSPALGQASAISLMILFRCATYVFPLGVSILLSGRTVKHLKAGMEKT